MKADETRLKIWGETLESQLEQVFMDQTHGDMTRWAEAFNNLPDIKGVSSQLGQDVLTLQSAQVDDEQLTQLLAALKGLKPWRKGPFDFFGHHIDTEWHSDWKWQRISPHISPLKNRRVLDVGCGSGYHMWRMLAEGAQRVIGVDPSKLFFWQFEAMKKYLLAQGQEVPVHFLPFKMEEVPAGLRAFDTVFSMGVLYHRRSPLEHLSELHQALRAGGEVVLETLVVDGGLGQVLMPEDRYAMMRNVWFLPSVETLSLWMRRVGFKDVKVVEQNFTSIEEQRTTDWMEFNSLKDFLDPNDHSKTIEGYPAPKRATLIAHT
ncbi:tRNA 5-methoxyuridine(34)/uridine 5-oxyacetic acid(34) synthase CmoB [Bermanella sp. 47_1433_sub80_T6]|nr:tRNA 5-methoxyuridine(34)/uridine 5-oxyacetic acid(34) synthase CmoB [Bermanella sp. 47_1433_sub80_T6]